MLIIIHGKQGGREENGRPSAVQTPLQLGRRIRAEEVDQEFSARTEVAVENIALSHVLHQALEETDIEIEFPNGVVVLIFNALVEVLLQGRGKGHQGKGQAVGLGPFYLFRKQDLFAGLLPLVQDIVDPGQGLFDAEDVFREKAADGQHVFL